MKKKYLYLACFLQAVFLTFLFSRVTYTDFSRFRKKIPPSTCSPAGQRLSTNFEEPSERPTGPLLFSLKIKNNSDKPETICVIFNSERLGEIRIEPRKTKKHFLHLLEERVKPQNRIELVGTDDRWELQGMEMSNIYGHSSGLFGFVILPKSMRVGGRVSGLFLLTVSLPFFLLGWLLATILLRKSAPSRFSFAVSLPALLVLVGAALLPAISNFRLLFHLRTLWVFLPWLYFGIILGISKILCGRAHAWLAFWWRMLQEAVKKALLKKNLLLSAFVPLVIFLFFVNVMLRTLNFFQKDYTRFICIAEEFGSRNPIFWNASPKLLFPNSDFERGSLENWTASGKAFVSQPTPRDNRKFQPHRGPRPLIHQGSYWVHTCTEPPETESARLSETLASIPFVIKEGRIGYLICGGSLRGDEVATRDSVALEVDGRVVREDTGNEDATMELRVWNVQRWLGKEARIFMTVDPNRLSPCLHVDWFHYYQEGRIDWIKKRLFTYAGGYDGQFYYFIAYDPFLSRFKDNPINYRGVVDEPAYRFGRIGFPLLIRIFSLDKPEKYPETMIWLILLSYLTGAFFLLRIIQFFKQSCLWAFLYILIPGFQISLHRACPEPISMAFLLAGLYFYLKRRIPAASLLFAGALLIRETTGFFILVVILVELFKRRNFRATLLLGASTLPLIFWRFFLTLRLFPCYGWATLFSHPRDFGLPFSGLVELCRRVLAGWYYEDLAAAGLSYPILLALTFLFSLYFLQKRTDALSLGLFIFTLVSLLLNYDKIWVHVDNGIRTTFEPFIFLILAFISQKESLKPALRGLFLGFFALVFVFNYFFSSLHPFFRSGFFLK